MSREKLVLFPYNGNAIEALDCLDSSTYDFLGFIDDDTSKTSPDYEIFGRDILQHKEIRLLAVPGSPHSFLKRKELISSLVDNEDRFITLIHPKVHVGRGVTIGKNCLIMAGVVLTSNAVIGDHVCILPNSVIHHDSQVQDYTLIGSGVVVAGGTLIGKNCYIGSGSSIINGISIGDHSLIGIGSNVLKDVNSRARMVGNPARNIIIN
ncbi:acetyltransferase [Salinimicrobium marinum]|uniref:Acetyltransferase n=1 Tax=Salinimicrobium marinum TaxID=680283 RepID=A0A918SLM2_9FLAO|nr:NeuD/PglB/VioB family sugar acetyltransferase [Salinimicrobium marinum]GHA48922.1 acetyltransferase [Salinimicrobium marinum]